MAKPKSIEPKISGIWRLIAPLEEYLDGDRALWNNHGVWWLVVFLKTADGVQAKRLRHTLRTRDIEVARKRRNRILKQIESLQTATVL